MVADALVVAADQRELDCGLDVEGVGPARLEHRGDVVAMDAIEGVVHVVERRGFGLVGVGVGLEGVAEEAEGLVAHHLEQPPDLGADRQAVDAAGTLGDVHHQIAGALELRGEPDGGDERPHVAGHGLLEGELLVAALLDVEGEVVELVVGVDERLRGGEVAVEEGLCPPGDGLDHERGETHEVAVDRVELVVEVAAGFDGHQERVYRTSAARWSGSPVMR